MGKQTAKVHYNGKDHSDIITTLGLGTEFQNEYGIFVPVNHYQICIKGEIVWERKKANMVVNTVRGICVSNDLIHLTSMNRSISSLDDNARTDPSSLMTFSNHFICSSSQWFLKSKDGFLWEKFYEKKGMMIQSGFIKCKCNGEDCVAAYMSTGEILFFNSKFELIKTVKTAEIARNMQPIFFGSEKTLYIYGVGIGENSYGTMEEYVDGELSIRHHFTYRDNIGITNAKLMYNNEEDSVYTLRNGVFCKYKHGSIYNVDASAIYNNTGERKFHYPFVPDGEAAIVKVYNFDDSSYSYYEFNDSIAHYRHNSKYSMIGRKNGVTLFGDLHGNNMFLTKDLFGVGLTEDECAMVKGIYSGIADIIDYAYME